MPDPNKVRLMTRLAILEKENGAELKSIRESFRSDYIGIPMLKNGLRITALFLMLLMVWAVCNFEFVLNIVAQMQLKLLAVGIITAYLVLLLVSQIVTFLCVSSRYHRSLRLSEEYQELLEELHSLQQTEDERMEGGTGWTL